MAKLWLSLFSVFLLLLLHISQALYAPYNPRNMYVGGKKGWVKKPAEGYARWAARNEFHVNDKLVFRYKKKKDSVLLVTKDAYNSCNTKRPIKKMASGDSWFRLDRRGEFFFISGRRGHCEKGQKLTVVVKDARARRSPPPQLPRPTPCFYFPSEPWLCSSAPDMAHGLWHAWLVVVMCTAYWKLFIY